jgi:hypothetical protein
MARARQRTFVDRLADAGEEAIQRLNSAPGADRILGAVNTLRERVDEMQKKMRGFDALERRLDAVERRLDKVERKGASARKRTPASGSSRKKTAG